MMASARRSAARSSTATDDVIIGRQHRGPTAGPKRRAASRAARTMRSAESPGLETPAAYPQAGVPHTTWRDVTSLDESRIARRAPYRAISISAPTAPTWSTENSSTVKRETSDASTSAADAAECSTRRCGTLRATRGARTRRAAPQERATNSAFSHASRFAKVRYDDSYAHGSVSLAGPSDRDRQRRSAVRAPHRRCPAATISRRSASFPAMPSCQTRLACSRTRFRIERCASGLMARHSPIAATQRAVIQRDVPTQTPRRQPTPGGAVAEEHRTARSPRFDDNVPEVFAERGQDHDVIGRQASLQVVMRGLACTPR